MQIILKDQTPGKASTAPISARIRSLLEAEEAVGKNLSGAFILLTKEEAERLRRENSVDFERKNKSQVVLYGLPIFVELCFE